MASTYVNDLRLNEMATGDASGTWGTVTNTNLELIGEALGFGTEAITTNADTHTTTVADGATDPGRAMYLKYTGTLDSACTITIAPNTMSRMQFIENGTSGSQNIIISQGSGANITIPAGDVKAVYLDGAGSGAAVVDAFASLNVVDLKVQDDLTVTDDATIGGTLGVTGIVTLTDDLIIGDGKTIGSASDVDAMTIASNGQITLTQTLIGTALDISGDIDVDGTTNLDVVDIDGAVDMASTLQVDGSITSSAEMTLTRSDNGINLSLVSTDADANEGPGMVLYRNSSSPADGDILGQIYFQGENDADQKVTYGLIEGTIIDASDGTEDGMLSIKTVKSGSTVRRIRLQTTEAVFNEDGSDIDFRVESDGNANMFVVDASTNRVGIGTNAPDSALHVDNSHTGTLVTFHQTAGASGDDRGLDVETSSTGTTVQRWINSGTELMRVVGNGNVGIGTTPAFTNGSGLEIQRNGIATLRLEDEGSSGKPFEIFVDDATGCQLKGTSSGVGMIFSVINDEAMRISTSKNLCIGTTANTGVTKGGLRLVYGSGESDGDTFFIGNGGASNAQAVTMIVVQGEGFNTNHGALHVGKHTGNSRSINAGGSINASGADYAEYMLKSDGCADIAKGEVCGVDADGKLTKTFSAAKSFVIKSTDPSYVGADTWWTEKEPEKYTDEGKTEYTASFKDWDTRREAARANVDRVAFSGQVPVNITGSFSVGDYVYPQANGSNIECVAKTTPTFEEYQLCVGKIWTTMDDGRPLVAVKIG